MKISHLVNGTKPSNGASAQQRSQSVSVWAKTFARVVNGDATKLVANDEVKALKDALNRLPW